MRRLLLSMTMLTAIAVIVPAVARDMQAPNSRVVMDIPDGFVAATRFSGFLQNATGASIVVFEAPGHAYEEMASGFTPEALASKQIVKAVAGKLPLAEPHVFVRAEQATPQGTYDKLFVLTRQQGVTALVSANVPRSAVELRQLALADVEKILASVRIAPAAVTAPAPFTLGYLGSFKYAGNVMGRAQLFTRDGRIEPPQKGTPRALVILAPSIDQQPILDVGPFAERALRSLGDYQNVAIVRVEAVRIAGLDGVAHTATAEEKQGSVRVHISQTLLVAPGGGYVRIVGIAPEAEAAELMGEFGKIASSLLPAP